MPLPHDELPGFLSKNSLLYTMKTTPASSSNCSDGTASSPGRDRSKHYTQRRRAQVEAANSMLLHELYFAGLAPARSHRPATSRAT